MSLTMYDASIPVFVRSLKNVSNILDKAATYAEDKKIDSTILVNSRLAPDMLPLARQIQIASDSSKGCAARLAGVEVPSFADDELTLADLKARISKTIDFLENIKASQVDGSENREITLKIGGKDMNFKGQSYLFNFALPNFYFHITIAYAILRHNGLEIGKKDYLAAL